MSFEAATPPSSSVREALGGLASVPELLDTAESHWRGADLLRDTTIAQSWATPAARAAAAIVGEGFLGQHTSTWRWLKDVLMAPALWRSTIGPGATAGYGTT